MADAPKKQLDDTTPLKGQSASGTGAKSKSGTPAPDLNETQSALEQAAKGGTNVDTLVGRLVVDNGLATQEEVQHEYVTKRQIARLRAIIEAERSGQKIPGFKILGKLGAGAMATVFRAVQLSLDRDVAIKVLPRKFSQNPQFIERFYAEGRSAAALNHPNIVQAIDVGKAGEFHYFVM